MTGAIAAPARRIASAFMLGCAGLVAVGLLGAAATERRQALWGVVQLCTVDMRSTGFAFPCLAVDLSQGDDRGYVVLRPPVGKPDTILSPTRKSIGIEDPILQTADAPNYFALAWNARRLAPGGEREFNEPEAMGLAVNSRFARQQDQLHIHMGCLRPSLRRRLNSLASRLPKGDWAPANAIIPDHEAWALRTGESDISRLHPFQLAAQGAASRPWGDIGSVTLAVAPVRIGANADFVLIAFPSLGLNPYTEIAAEDLLDARCRVEGE